MYRACKREARYNANNNAVSVAKYTGPHVYKSQSLHAKKTKKYCFTSKIYREDKELYSPYPFG